MPRVHCCAAGRIGIAWAADHLQAALDLLPTLQGHLAAIPEPLRDRDVVDVEISSCYAVNYARMAKRCADTGATAGN